MPDLSWAERVLTEAVEAAATSGDRRLAAHALVQRGLFRLFTEHNVTPQELFDVSDRAIAVFGELGDDLGLARAWRLVGQAHYLDRRPGRCAEASEQALVHARRAGDPFELREVVEWLIIALLLGPTPVQEATVRCEKLLDETSGYPEIHVQTMAGLAALTAMQGRAAEGVELMNRTMLRMDEIGEWIWVAAFWMGFVSVWLEDLASAENVLRPAYAALGEMGEKSHFSSIAHSLANVTYAQGDYDEAERMTHECETACRPNDVHSHILWRSIRAKVLARRQAFEEAERLGREAIELAEAGDFLLAQGDALADFAEVLELAGRSEEATAAYRRAIELHELKGNLLAARRTGIRLEALTYS
jgi:tetratricopeptide (TPR) repeat protein